MAKERAYGADAQLLGAFEPVYGTAPDGSGGGVYRKLSFKSSTLGAERPLGYDPLLGQGRDAQDPHYEALTDDGEIEVPLDLQGIGFWLRALFGTPTSTGVKATGTITFAANPSDGHTIALNGTVWTFVAAGAAGNETNIQATLADTLTQLRDDLNASGDAEVSKCTYSAGPTALTIEFDTAGPSGNGFTVAASNAAVSAATLMGGHYAHIYKSGGELPSLTLEIGHTALATPEYIKHTGAKCESLAFEMQRTGPANATFGLVAQGESAPAPAAADAAPLAYTLTRFNRGSGAILMDGVPLANVTAGRFSFSNNFERVETIRDDGLIDGADETEATATGSVDVRYSTDTTIPEAVRAETPVALTYKLSIPGSAGGYAIELDLPRVFLPRKKQEIRGPGGISASFEWRAAKDTVAGHMLQVTLKNDVASYA